MNIKQTIKSIPLVGPVARHIYQKWINPPKPFQGSESYWKNRYDDGGNSGDGSYNQLAEFKANILNKFVYENGITSVIEYGCGDGNQLGLAKYPKYQGFDVSPKAISICSARFSKDHSKSFTLVQDYAGQTAELTLSLDVIFHLIEDEVFEAYIDRLFDSSEKFVIIFSSDTDENPESTAQHVKHRNFSRWITDKKSAWKLMDHIPNQHPFKGDNRTGSFADFFIYAKA